jgi:hypothetical protein
VKKVAFICFIIFLSLALFSCAPKSSSLEVFVAEVDSGVMIQNAGNTDCTVFVQWTSGEQQFDLATGESITLEDIQKPVEVSAVSLRDKKS